MKFKKILSDSIKFILCSTLFFPMVAFAHLISIVATSPFPSSVFTSATATAIFKVTNITSKVPLTVIDKSHFPRGSGLSISSTNCGSVMGPGQSCTIRLQIIASATPQTIHAELREWAKPSVDGVRFPFTIAVVSPQKFVVTPTAGSNGTISPSTAQTVNIGDSLTFTATPASGFTVNEWRLDGSLVQTGGTSYTLNNITANHAVNVSFSPEQFIVTPSAGTGGSINPSTPQTVNSGSSLIFTATPSTGFAVDQWLLDGGVVQTGGLTFTLNNITSNHTVQVTFFSGLIALGNYRNTTTIQTPLIFFSSNNGSAWSPETTTLPADFTSDGLIAASSCTGINCIGAGIYNNGAINRPLLIFSSNAGNTWVSVTAPVPVDFVSSASVKAATCESSTCVSVGSYSNGALQKALISVSNDSGASWSTVAPTLPANFLNLASLNTTVCTGSTCVAGGSYTRVGNVQLPLLLVSNNSGASWASVTPTLPPTYSDLGTINSVTCEGSVCIATGVFFEAGFQARPLVLVSNNLGSSWGFVTPSLPGDFSNFGFFNAVTCIGSVCNGAGNYSDGSVTKPLLFHSTDSGASWSSVTTTLPPNFSDITSLRSIACTGSNCIAAGDYADASFIQFPMLLVSNTQGASWTSFALTLPADFSDFGTINALNCSGNICTAVGEYTNTSNIELPLIYVSSNSGITWSLITPTLPANFSDLGILNGTSGTL